MWKNWSRLLLEKTITHSDLHFLSTTTFHKYLKEEQVHVHVLETNLYEVAFFLTSPSPEEERADETISWSEPTSEPSEGLVGEFGVSDSQELFRSILLGLLVRLGLFTGPDGLEFFTELELGVLLIGLNNGGGAFEVFEGILMAGLFEDKATLFCDEGVTSTLLNAFFNKSGPGGPL